MTELARRAPDNSMLVARNLSLRQASLVIFQTTGQWPLGDGLVNWSPADLYAAEIVFVAPVAPPTLGDGLEFGEGAVQDPQGEKYGAEPWLWREKWDVVPNMTLPEVKADLRAAARRLLIGFTEDLSGPEIGLVLEVGLAELEQARMAEVGGAFDASRYPLVQGVAAAQSPPVTFAQAGTYIRDNLVGPWKGTVGQYLAKYLDVIFRIQAIAPGAGAAQAAKDIYDELEGYTPT